MSIVRRCLVSDLELNVERVVLVAVEEAGERYFEAGRMKFPAEVWIVSGKKV